MRAWALAQFNPDPLIFLANSSTNARFYTALEWKKGSFLPWLFLPLVQFWSFILWYSPEVHPQVYPHLFFKARASRPQLLSLPDMTQNLLKSLGQWWSTADFPCSWHNEFPFMGKDIVHISTSSPGKAQEKRPDVGFCSGFLWCFPSTVKKPVIVIWGQD